MKNEPGRNKIIWSRLSRVFSWLAVISIVIGVTVPQAFAEISPDLTFCPLLKTWVKRTNPTQSSPDQPLTEICATGNTKQRFFVRSIQELSHARTNLSNSEITKLFFNYSREGDRAFSSVKAPINDPASQLTQVQASQKSAITNQSDFGKKEAEVYRIGNFRNPQSDACGSPFEWSRLTEAISLLDSNRSRAPPFSL